MDKRKNNKHINSHSGTWSDAFDSTNEYSQPKICHFTYPLRALLRVRLLFCGFRNVKCFTGKGFWPFAQPPTWGSRCCNSSDLSPGTCPERLNLPGSAVPAGIASRVTKARKSPHHDKVQHLGGRNFVPLIFVKWKAPFVSFPSKQLNFVFQLHHATDARQIYH